jgi:hypothetical protein
LFIPTGVVQKGKRTPANNLSSSLLAAIEVSAIAQLDAIEQQQQRFSREYLGDQLVNNYTTHIKLRQYQNSIVSGVQEGLRPRITAAKFFENKAVLIISFASQLALFINIGGLFWKKKTLSGPSVDLLLASTTVLVYL